MDIGLPEDIIPIKTKFRQVQFYVTPNFAWACKTVLTNEKARVVKNPRFVNHKYLLMVYFKIRCIGDQVLSVAALETGERSLSRKCDCLAFLISKFRL